MPLDINIGNRTEFNCPHKGRKPGFRGISGQGGIFTNAVAEEKKNGNKNGVVGVGIKFTSVNHPNEEVFLYGSGSNQVIERLADRRGLIVPQIRAMLQSGDPIQYDQARAWCRDSLFASLQGKTFAIRVAPSPTYKDAKGDPLMDVMEIADVIAPMAPPSSFADPAIAGLPPIAGAYTQLPVGAIPQPDPDLNEDIPF